MLTKDDKKWIKENTVSKSDLKKELANYATKADLKKELANYATKADLKKGLANYATKADLKKELANYATKADIEKFATKDDLAVSGYNLRTEMAKMEQRIEEKAASRHNELMGLFDGLAKEVTNNEEFRLVTNHRLDKLEGVSL